MYKRILVPLDGSALAERALPFACRLAVQHDAELLLARVVEPRTPLVSEALDAASVEHSAVGAAQLYLDRLAGDLDVRQPIRTVVYYGDAVDGILEEIRLRRADLVVMATHGRTGLRVVLGSVADAVARQADVPVLLVPPAGARAWGTGTSDRGGDRPLTILAPLDGSPLAEEALTPLEALAERTATRVTLYGVVQLIPALYYRGGHQAQMKDAGGHIDALEAYLARQAARVSGLADVRTLVEFGSPARRISEQAREGGTDLVVMATHGRGGLSRLLLGSVATSVLHQLEIPLLLVRARGIVERTADTRQISRSQTRLTLEAAR
jgi:nucleotide-binding universal stress UspA family protein